MAQLSREIFPVIKLSGSAEEIGFEHGRLLAGRIERCWAFYERIIGAPRSELQRLALTFANQIRAFSADYADEIEAISAGAGLPSWQIYALNSRTELIRMLKRKEPAPVPGECTALYFPETNILGQTWDWALELLSLTVIMEITRPGKPRIIQITEPGIIGKIGLNSCGVGVSLIILRAPLNQVGVPVHILLRAVLDSNTTAEALQRLSSAPLGTMGHLCIADRGGNCAPIEIAGSALAYCPLSRSPYVHTNHFITLPIENPKAAFASSHCRFDRAAELARQVEKQSLDEMQRILTDTENGGHAICHDFVEDDVIVSEGTLSAVICEPTHRRIHICPGSPLGHSFECYELHEHGAEPHISL